MIEKLAQRAESAPNHSTRYHHQAFQYLIEMMPFTNRRALVW